MAARVGWPPGTTSELIITKICRFIYGLSGQHKEK